jgi:hypothetical protein
VNKSVIIFAAGFMMASGTSQLVNTPPAECKVNTEVQSMASTLQQVVVEQTTTLKKSLESVLNQCSK